MTKVLVAYASKYGATAEIAGKIGEVLTGEGLQVELKAVKEVKDLSPYGAAVLGVAMYMGQWRKEASKFLKANENTLAGLPVWLYVSGPTGEGDPVKLMEGREVPGGIKPVIERIKSAEVTVFHGAILPEKMSGFEKWIIKRVKAKTGDFRDWNAISAWAKGIAGKLKG